jgi:hypothetical protein
LRTASNSGRPGLGVELAPDVEQRFPISKVPGRDGGTLSMERETSQVLAAYVWASFGLGRAGGTAGRT